jgi:hypothetical protein
MVQSKIEIFTAMLAEQPENAMIWHPRCGGFPFPLSDQ